MAITVLRARIDEEFRIAERLDTKSRQVFALATGFFAVVQTVAFGSFGGTGVTAAERVLVGLAGVVAGVALVIVAHRLVNGEETLEELDVLPSSIVAWTNEAKGNPEYVLARLVSGLASMAERRSENNEIRGHHYASVANASRWVLILSGAELVLGVVVRI